MILAVTRFPYSRHSENYQWQYVAYDSLQSIDPTKCYSDRISENAQKYFSRALGNGMPLEQATEIASQLGLSIKNSPYSGAPRLYGPVIKASELASGAGLEMKTLWYSKTQNSFINHRELAKEVKAAFGA